MVIRLKENDAYPNDWRPSRDSASRVFDSLDQSQSKNPGWLEDNYGLSKYDVKWSSPSKDTINIYASMDNGEYRYDETFYIYPDTEKDTYIIETSELGERTVGKLTDVLDIISTCLRKQMKDSYKESLITEKNWSITVPNSLAKAFREELNAIDDWDSEEEQTEHIEKAMGALINICKFINNQDPDLFEDAEDDINNMLDNIYNYEEYEMHFEDAKGEIDYWLNDFWDTCDSENIFIPV